MADLSNLDVQWVSLVDRAAVRDPDQTDQPMRFLVWKREGANPNEGGLVADQDPKITEALAKAEKAEAERDDLKAQLEKAQADAEEAKAALEKAQAETAAGERENEQIDKSELPEPVRAALEKAETERQAMAERLEKAEQAAATERNERLTREFVAKAEGYKALPVNPAELGPVLKAASEKLTTEEYQSLERLLKAADAQITETGLFAEQGRSRPGEPQGALAEAKKAAEELRKSDSSLSESQALDRVLSSDRALQERYLAEVRG